MRRSWAAAAARCAARASRCRAAAASRASTLSRRLSPPRSTCTHSQGYGACCVGVRGGQLNTGPSTFAATAWWWWWSKLRAATAAAWEKIIGRLHWQWEAIQQSGSAAGLQACLPCSPWLGCAAPSAAAPAAPAPPRQHTPAALPAAPPAGRPRAGAPPGWRSGWPAQPPGAA